MSEKTEKPPEDKPAQPIRKGIRLKGPPPPEGSREAKKVAAAILEVLGGMLRPLDAATSLGVTLPRYYQLESRALEGLVRACEPRSKGRGPSKNQPLRELEGLREQVKKLQHEGARYAALLRASQRAAGLPTPPPKAKPEKGKRQKRTPTVRALLAVRRMKSEEAETQTTVPALALDGERV